MLKKIISVFLSAMLITALAAPAFAEESQDEALKRVTLAVKNTLGIDNSYTDFSGNLSDGGDFSYWNLRWSKEDVGLSVCADENGKVLNYNKNTNDSNYYDYTGYSPAFPKVSREDGLSSAKAFVEKLLTANETVSFNKFGSGYNTENTVSYWFDGVVNLNGLKSPVSFNVKILLSDMSVIHFNRSDFGAAYTKDIPSATPSVTAAAASSLLNGKVNLRLQYVLNEDGKTAVLQYLPIYMGDYAVDAQTGALIDLSENLYFGYSKNGGRGETADATAAEEAGISDAEQSTISTLEGVYSKSELDTKVRAVTSLGIDSAYTLDSANYTMDKASGNVQCSIDYIKKISDKTVIKDRFPTDYAAMTEKGGDYPIYIHKSVTLDAKTGSLITMYSYNTANNETATLSNEKLKTTAETFLNTHFSEKYKLAAYNESDSNTEEGSYVYAQTVNGVLFPTNYLSISVNTYDGTIDSFNTSWTDGVSFASATGVVSAEAARTAYIACYKTVLQYVQVPLDNSAADSISYPRYETDGKLLLAYKYESENYVTGVDATSGKAIYETINDAASISYSDLAGCYGKTQIEKLAQYGIGFPGTSFLPTAQLTQKDALVLLLSAVGYSVEDEDGLYQAAYSYELLTKAEKAPDKLLTRVEFIKMLVGATEYGAAAKLEGIYKSGFRDDAKITTAYYGYVSIAKALGIVKGDAKNNFNPDTILTRQDSAIMLYNFMSR